MTARSEIAELLLTALQDVEGMANRTVRNVDVGSGPETRTADGVLLRALVMRAELYVHMLDSPSQGVMRMPR